MGSGIGISGGGGGDGPASDGGCVSLIVCAAGIRATFV